MKAAALLLFLHIADTFIYGITVLAQVLMEYSEYNCKTREKTGPENIVNNKARIIKGASPKSGISCNSIMQKNTQKEHINPTTASAINKFENFFNSGYINKPLALSRFHFYYGKAGIDRQ